MKRRMQCAAAVVLNFLLCSAAIGQSTAPPPAKPLTPAALPPADIADVHPSPHSFYSTYFRAVPPSNGRYVLHQATLVDLISIAYGVERDTVLGGPSWLDFDRFDLTLRVPADATRDTANLMLRATLAERFKLVSHPDIKPLPAYLLKVPNGAEPKIKRADAPAEVNPNPDMPISCQFQRPATPPTPNGPQPSSYSFQCRGMTMAQYAQDLHLMTSYAMNKPIVDATGLKGVWDFDVMYGLRSDHSGLDVQPGIEKLGMRLELGTAPQPVVVVESAMEKPTPNPPAVATALPPPPQPGFDVATIKPSLPSERDMQFRGNTPNQMTIAGASLQALLGEAYDISGAMVNGPDYITKLRWTITGKVNADPQAKPGASQGFNFGELRLMIRSLLAERFALQGHFEDRPGDAYVLTAANPKLKKADPTVRTSCTDRPADGKDPRATNSILDRYISCQNISLDQFAAEIQYYALDYIKSPVLNSTNLPGSYDITLRWSNSRAARNVAPPTAPPPGESGGGTAPAPSDSAATSDPSGAISLPDAIAKQLGLKMQLQKRPIPMLVVDNLTETPTEN